MTEPTIRRARPEDVTAIRGVAEEAWAQTYRDIIPADTQKIAIAGFYDEKALAEAIASDSSLFLIAERNGEVIAFAQCVIDAPSAELTRIYVRPRHQRSRVGRQLLDRMTNDLTARSVRSLATSVETANRAARDFYARAGFASGDNESVDLFGCRVDLTRYTLPISARS